jgi:sugar lactone lactonase YvrE
MGSTYIPSISYTPDGSEIVGLDGAASIYRVDADTLEPIGEPIPLEPDTAEAADEPPVDPGSTSLTISPDGRTAFAALTAGTSAWVDLAEGRILHQDDLGLEPAHTALSPDGRRLAVAANTGEVGLLQLETWTWTRPPTAAHSAVALGVTWAADGTLFASYRQDGRISLWDGRTGEPLGTVRLGGPSAWTIANFMPDGHTLIAATTDNEVFTWDTRLETWVERACAIAGRNLTTQEWRQAFGDRPYRNTCPAD